MLVPAAIGAVHVPALQTAAVQVPLEVQLKPPALEVTVPLPVPESTKVSE